MGARVARREGWGETVEVWANGFMADEMQKKKIKSDGKQNKNNVKS